MGHYLVSTGLLSRAVHVTAGLILVAAATLKFHRLYWSPSAVDVVLGMPLLAAVVVFAEVILGIWLFTGLRPATGRVAGLGVFALFFLVAAYQAATGRDSCGCFGFLKVTPPATAVLDLITVGLLAFLRPPAPPTVRTAWVRAGGICCAVATAGWAATVITPPPPLLAVEPAIIDMGTVVQGQRTRSEVLVHNLGADPIAVVEVKTTCPCLTIRFEHDQVIPGQPVRVIVTLDMNREPDYTGDLAIDVEIVTAGGLLVGRFTVEASVTK